MKRKKQELIHEMVKDGTCCYGCINFDGVGCLENYDSTVCPYSNVMAEWFYDMGFRRSTKYMRKKYGGDEK